MKTKAFCLVVHLIPLLVFAQPEVKLKIENVVKDGGKIYVSVFNSESSYKAREVYLSFSLEANNETAIKDLSLPNGHYLFSVYQDSNGNGKLDTSLMGIPREKFGFSNYDGKSAPGSFNRHKILISEKCSQIIITLFEI